MTGIDGRFIPMSNRDQPNTTIRRTEDRNPRRQQQGRQQEKKKESEGQFADLFENLADQLGEHTSKRFES